MKWGESNVSDGVRFALSRNASTSYMFALPLLFNRFFHTPSPAWVGLVGRVALLATSGCVSGTSSRNRSCSKSDCRAAGSAKQPLARKYVEHDTPNNLDGREEGGVIVYPRRFYFAFFRGEGV